MRDRILISFVIPCYRSENTIQRVIDEIVSVVSEKKDYDYEIIAVNDCSPDGVYEVLRRIAAENNRVKVVDLVKNMGKHSAVMAGYAFVSGQFVVNLDDDYQSPVNRLWDLLQPLEMDICDVTTAQYYKKKEPFWKRIGSDVNYYISRVMLDKPKGIRFENLSVLKRFVVDEIIKYRNPFPFLEGLILRVTKRIITVPMEERERADDKSSGFTLWRSLSLFANGFTNFSVKPLRFALIVGIIFAFVGFFLGIIIIGMKLRNPGLQLGWSSIMAVLLFSSGMIMLLLGMIGEYVGRIFICINDAPQYVIRRTLNVQERFGGESEI